MKCPKCEEGEIKNVILKLNGETGYLCDFCEMFWFEGEKIRLGGRPFTITDRNVLEYILETTEDKDQEHRSAQYTNSK